jgi:hypothetical protein
LIETDFPHADAATAVLHRAQAIGDVFVDAGLDRARIV